MTRMEAGLPVNPTIPIRTRFFDDRHLVRLLAEPAGWPRSCLVAAGMDTRAYRLEFLADVIVFETRPALPYWN